jgi:hypothetical protein
MFTIYSLITQPNDPMFDLDPDAMHILKTCSDKLEGFYDHVLVFDDSTAPVTVVRNDYPTRFMPSTRNVFTPPPHTQARNEDIRLFWKWFIKENHTLPTLYIDDQGWIMRRYLNTVRPLMQGPDSLATTT